MIITLPFPDRELNPNRKKWSIGAMHRHRRLYEGAKQYAHWLTKCEMNKPENAIAKLVGLTPTVTFTFHMPDRRKRDLDNAIAANKAAQDGIAEALVVDDSKWDVSYHRGDVIKGGRVIVEVKP